MTSVIISDMVVVSQADGRGRAGGGAQEAYMQI